jgi:hypothetical protein
MGLLPVKPAEVLLSYTGSDNPLRESLRESYVPGFLPGI